jgi:hypothetical protein
VNPAQNGTYARNVAVMGTQTGIGDGYTAPTFDGTNDVVNIYTAALVAALNTAEGTFSGWAKVSGAGVWTDGANRQVFRVQSSVNSFLYIRKQVANNTIRNFRRGNGVDSTVDINPINATSWQHFAITWSVSAGINGEFKAFWNGAQTGATQVNLGVWAGILLNTGTVLGAASTVPTEVWSGGLQHHAFWDSALAPGIIADLATV